MNSYYSYMARFMQALRECEGHAPHDLDLSQPTVLRLRALSPLSPWHAVSFPHEHGERGFGGERAASLEHTGGGEAAADR